MIPRQRRIDTEAGALPAVLFGDGPKVLLVLGALGEERKGSVRPLADLARALAGEGWTVCLFDPAGDGDGPGDFAAISWDRLREQADAALDAVRVWGGAKRVSLLGVRLGARLALEAAANRPDRVAALCLWAPVTDGRKWRKEAMRRSRFRQRRDDAPPGDIDGYVYGEALSNALDAMTDDPPRPECPCAVVSIGRSDPSPGDRRLAERLSARAYAVPTPPFWLATGVVDTDPLVAITSEALETLNP